MDRSDITELYYIAPIVNVPSIMQHGILSHNLADRVSHHSVAMSEIQERRKDKQIPGARTLHEYANLYFDAHNPMLSRRRTDHNDLCVLRVDTGVLDLSGVIIANCNAASGWASFCTVADGLKVIDRNRVFAQYWTHSEDPYDEWSHKAEKCAEVLVPDRVVTESLLGAYVANQTALTQFQQLDTGLLASIRNDIFF